MNQDHKNAEADDRLGLNARIDRRDLLNSTLLAAGSLLLSSSTPLDLLAEEDWTGYSGVGDYASSNGNTFDVMSAGHRQIRDHRVPAAAPIDTREQFDCVVVGGGISGLAAALFLRRQTKNKTCLVLDNHPVFGGEAKRNEFLVDGQHLMIHQGSAACFPPLPNSFLAGFYDSLGIRWPNFKYQAWQERTHPELPLETAPYPNSGKTSALFFGAKFGHPEGLWLHDPWGKRLVGAPIAEHVRQQLLKRRDADRKPFSAHALQPKSHGDMVSRHLDSITLEQHFTEAYGLSAETTRAFLSPIAGGGSGIGADALSAYAEYAADVLLPWQYDAGAQMFPGGNAGVARHLVKQLNPAAISGTDTMHDICRGQIHFDSLDHAPQSTRIRLGATVVSVVHDGDPQHASTVLIDYVKDGQLQRVRAKSVILAGGSWTSKHIARDLPAACRQAYSQFHRAPCLMANVAVRNWRFLYDQGLTECQWFEGIGNYLTLRKVATFGTDPSVINPDAPTVLNLKILFSYPGEPLETQLIRGRQELLSTPFRTYERRIREHFDLLFARYGFNAARDIAGIILNRWGHAYLSAQPGFFFGLNGAAAPGETLRHSNYGRLAFANSDLSGIMDHRMSILEAQRAVTQILPLVA